MLKSKAVHWKSDSENTLCSFNIEYFKQDPNPLRCTKDPKLITCKMCRRVIKSKIRKAKAELELFRGM